MRVVSGPPGRRAVLPATLLTAALIASACGTPEETTGSAGDDQVRTVQIDGREGEFRGAYRAFFPEEVRVGPGDTVVFRNEGLSEGHAVAIGRIPAEAVAAHEAGEDYGELPRVDLTDRDLVPSAVEACFMEDEPPPLDRRRCPEPESPPVFDGTQTYFSSGMLRPEPTTGWLDGGEEFTLRLSEDIEPGRYPFLNPIHGPAMSGAIIVEEAGSPIPSQADVDEEGAAELRAMAEEVEGEVQTLLDRFEDVEAGDMPWPAQAGKVLMDGQVVVNEFFPFTIRAQEGEEVTWNVEGIHSISFSAPGGASAPMIEKDEETGHVRIPRDNVINVRSDDPPEEPPADPVVLDGGERARGSESTHSSGLLRSPEGQITYRMVFPEAATYRYQCLVHPGMEGLVMVSGT